MADETIVPPQSTAAGVVWGWLTPVLGTNYLFASQGNELLLVDNASDVDVTVTIYRNAPYDGEAPPNREVVVAAGTKKSLGLFNSSVYHIRTGNDKGKVKFTFSAVTDVSFAVIAAN